MTLLSRLKDAALDLLAGSRRLSQGRERRLHPESRWIVTLSSDRISVSDQDGDVRDVALDDVAVVSIETNDSGPWGTDFWWLLYRADGELACAFPQGATGEKEAMEWILALPGFDHEAMIVATGSTANETHLVWKR